MNAPVCEINSDLEACEKVIAAGLRSFAKAGQALARIRDAELYKPEHATFDDYCRARWRLSRGRAYQLIEAAEAMSTICRHDLPAPVNEAQVRELTKLPATERATAWAKAVATAPEGRVTAKHVARVVTGSVGEPMEDGEKLVPKLRLVDKPAAPSKRTLARIETDEKIRELTERGLAPHEIQKELGLLPNRVQSGKRRLGLHRRRGPIEGLINSAIEGFDTWEMAVTETAAQWAAASREELGELIGRLGDLVGSVNKLRRALKKELTGRSDP